VNLRQQLKEAEDNIIFLRNKIARSTCEQAGHDMKFVGGANAGCCEDCICSVPVHECSQCGACDFGDNEEARDIMSQCTLSKDAFL